ncbi:uncharacterized protein LOC117108252 [Anneissia japonica]|uniref:uncharacterized protein LOC117108252 n=1 Tax=Anneissia japonica TaxID=1529436 RepID=UPI00142590B6|nr:uncharacterized protein LOC117108252 [Anneissia japonica]
MEINRMEIVYIFVVICCASAAAQSATLQTSSNSEESYAGRTVTLTCDVENGFDVTRHQIYWSKLDGAKETYLSSDRTVYTSVEASLQRRLSITGDIKQGFFNLRIRETNAEDAGIYMCVLFDKKGIDKASIRLDLRIIPVFPPEPGYPKCEISPQKPKLNDKVTFTCTSKGSNPKVSLNWMRADDSISQNNVANSGINGVTTKHVITQGDNMVPFTCVASGTALITPINCSVIPFAFPTTVNISPSLGKLRIGQDVTLTCTAVAIPSPERFKWTYGKGKQLVKIARSTGRLQVLKNGRTLKIKNISKDDNNVPVRCTVRNSIDIKGSKEITLKVALPKLPPKVTRVPEINPRIPIPKPTMSRGTNRPRFMYPNIPMNERALEPHVTSTSNNVPKNNAPSGNPPLFDKHQPTNNGRAGLLTGGLIGIACLLGAIFLVALMLVKLKRDEKSGLVINTKQEHSVTYTPERYTCLENSTSFTERLSTNNEDTDLSQAVQERLHAEQSLRDSIVASQAKKYKRKLPKPLQNICFQTTTFKNDLARTKSSSISESTYRRPNLVFKRFARPVTVGPPAISTSLKTHSLPPKCNLITEKPPISTKPKITSTNVEGLLYAELDFTNVKSSKNIIPNSCETTYADITTFLKK